MRYVDLVEHQPAFSGQKRRKPLVSWKTIFSVFAGLAVITIAYYLFPLIKLGWNLSAGPKAVLSFVSDEEVKSAGGRTNVLLLGIGGSGHIGPQLSDTIMVISVGVNTHDVAILSLPRDVWVGSLAAKINSAYAFGEEKQLAGGKILARSAVNEISGLPIHYVVRIDFAGFKRAIDLVNGIEVSVDREFDDPRYPKEGKEFDDCGYREEILKEKIPQESSASGKSREIEIEVIYYIDASGSAKKAEDDPYACRFEKLHFAAGRDRMDGTKALKYVRSRNGTNNEGSDFARAKRQQKVITAFKDKVLSVPTLIDANKLASLIEVFGESIDTDITPEDIGPLLKLAQKIDFGTTKHIVLSDQGDNSLLVNPSPQHYQGAWVLVSRTGDWQSVHRYIKEQLEPNPSPTQSQ